MLSDDLAHEQSFWNYAAALKERDFQINRARDSDDVGLYLRRLSAKWDRSTPCLGRALDLQHNSYYVGPEAIWNGNTLVVVGIESEAGKRWRDATPQSPQGLLAKRVFHIDNGILRGFEDAILVEDSQTEETSRSGRKDAAKVVRKAQTTSNSTAKKLEKSPEISGPSRAIQRAAGGIADEIAETFRPAMWETLLHAIAKELDERRRK